MSVYTGLRPETDRARHETRHSGRVLVALGDSIVYGWGVSSAESYPALIETWVNASAQGAPWQIVNAGVPGDTVVMGSDRYARDVRSFEPDVVLLAFGLNDGALRRTQFDAQREKLWRAAHHPTDRAALVIKRWVNAALGHIGNDSGPPPQVERVQSPRVEPALFVRALGDLARCAERDGAKVIVAPLAPVASSALATVSQSRMAAEQWASYVRYNHLITELVDRQKLGLVDLTSNPQPERPETMLVEDGVHMTAAGQMWLATRIHASLKGMIEAYAGQDVDR